MSVFLINQVACGVALRMERIDGDDDIRNIERIQEILQLRDFIGFDTERSPVFGNYNMFTVVGPEFFASNECRDRGDRPRRVAESRDRPP